MFIYIFIADENFSVLIIRIMMLLVIYREVVNGSELTRLYCTSAHWTLLLITGPLGYALPAEYVPTRCGRGGGAAFQT